MTDDAVEILLHGPPCPEWIPPQTTAECVELSGRLTEEADGTWYITCPVCGEAFVWGWAGPIIEFGVDR